MELTGCSTCFLAVSFGNNAIQTLQHLEVCWKKDISCSRRDQIARMICCNTCFLQTAIRYTYMDTSQMHAEKQVGGRHILAGAPICATYHERQYRNPVSMSQQARVQI